MNHVHARGLGGRAAWLRSGARLALLAALGTPALYATGAAAQSEPAPPTEVDTLVVTGSLIAGTPETTSLPVNVITAEDLEKQGGPTLVELIKQLPVSSAAIGESNQWDARSSILAVGTATVNLRGLGSGRTLVLLNGRRITGSPRTDGTDVNIFPQAAIGRIEVLKEGAAATYGSDAISGVVNFITKRNLDGLEAGGSYSFIDGSDGDFTGFANWGWVGERSNVLLSLGYQRRGELPAQERDWAIRPYLENPQGGWSNYGQPGTYFGLFGAFRDPYCGTAGTFRAFSGTVPVCGFQLSQYYNIVEKTDQTQVYGELNTELASNLDFHGEFLLARTDVASLANSPSSPALQSPTGLTSPFPGFYTVPLTNPGAAAFAAANPGTPALPPGFLGATGGYIASIFRPFGVGGNPLYDYGTLRPKNRSNAFRISGELSGSFGDDIDWSSALTYSSDSNVLISRDALVDRLQLSLNGLGGPDCNRLTGTPGVGDCLWFNPFSNSIERNILTGEANPLYSPALGGNPQIGNDNLNFLKWLTPRLGVTSTTRLVTWDNQISGLSNWELGGGRAAWALGFQYRQSNLEVDVDPFYDIDAFPCIDSPIGDDSCVATGRTPGPLTFYVQYRDLDKTTTTYAAFGELSLPVTDDLQVQLALRYEDHGEIGTTLNPKVAAKWQVADFLALRASYDTSFRQPPAVSVTPTPLTSVAFLGGAFRQIRTSGDPGLDPEEGKSFNIGAIVETDNLVATLDYWSIEFTKPIGVEPFLAMYNAMFPAAGPNNCGAAAFAELQARFVFGAGGCSIANLQSININFANGAGIDTSGIDAAAEYTMRDVFGGDVRFGADATYNLEYKVGPTSVAGIPNIQPGSDRVGQLNYGSTAYPLPQWKGNAFLEYSGGVHNLRLTVHYIDGYTDERTDIYAALVNTNPGPGGPGTGTGAFDAANNITVTSGKTIDAFVTADLVYRARLPWDTTASVAVVNMFDEDPPFARLDMNYDPFTASGVGRMIKLNVTKKF